MDAAEQSYNLSPTGCLEELSHVGNSRKKSLEKTPENTRSQSVSTPVSVSKSVANDNSFQLGDIPHDLREAIMKRLKKGISTLSDYITELLACITDVNITNSVFLLIAKLMPSIAKLINLSLSSGTFPCRWKRARVTALHKAGDMDDVNNYRPISVLPVLSKIIERHVHDHLSDHLNDHDLIYKNQSGFRKQYSTETALAYIVDTLLFNLDKNHVNGLVLVDYKKAFDMVDHVTLLSKLEAYKLDSNALLWFSSYLTDQTQLVSFKVAP
ncbi:hypothetical protein ACROYT_G014201 [Oculina patagonica]